MTIAEAAFAVPPPLLDVIQLPEHRYKVDGYNALSVTRIASVINKGNLERWSSESCKEFGSMVHTYVHADLNNDLVEGDYIHEDVMRCVNASRAFMKDFQCKPVLIEQAVGCKFPLFAGQLDTVVIIPSGDFWLIDWKTGGEYEYIPIQLAGYDIALRQTFAIKVKKRMAVYLEKSGKYRRPEVYSNPLHLDVFKACHTIACYQAAA